MNRPAWATASAASRRNGQNQWRRRPLAPYSSSPASTSCSRALCERLANGRYDRHHSLLLQRSVRDCAHPR